MLTPFGAKNQKSRKIRRYPVLVPKILLKLNLLNFYSIRLSISVGDIAYIFPPLKYVKTRILKKSEDILLMRRTLQL